MLGVSLSLTRAGRAVRSGVAPPPPPPPPPGETTDPNVTLIQADGWRATYQSPPAAFDPEADPKPVVVSRQGFNAAGQAVAVPEVLTVMARVREPWPNQATPTATDAALSDFVYQGDTVEGVTNASTRAYPKPFAMWLDHDMQRVEGTTYTARLAVAHAHARSGRPVAAVRFSVSDGTTTVEATVSAMSVIAYPATGLSVPHFAADLDLSGLAADTPLTVDATLYPWVGEAFTISVDGEPYPSPNLTVLKILRVVSYGTAYAYVDAGLGDNGTAVVSETSAAAEAAPFATVGAAADAIRAFNSATFGRDSVSGGVIRLMEGTHVHGSINEPVDHLPLVVEAAGARAATLYRDAGGHTIASLPAKVLFRGITFQRTTGGVVIFLDGNAPAGGVNMTVFEDCAFDLNGFSAPQSSYIQRLGRVWMIGCTGDDLTVADQSVDYKAVAGIGSGGGVLGNACMRAVACRDPEARISVKDAVGNQPACRAAFYGWNHMGNGVGGAALVIGGGTDGCAIVGNVLEGHGVSNGPTFDANLTARPVDGVLMAMNTVVGQRTNAFYLASGSGNNAKTARDRFSVHWSWNTKGDVFEEDGTLTGNWPVLWKAGFRACGYLTGGHNGDTPGPGIWMGEIAALGDAGGTDAAPLVTDWADDRSVRGGAAPGSTGGGDYTPGPGHALPAVPAGLAPWSHDMKGRAVADDGTAAAGALQPL